MKAFLLAAGHGTRLRPLTDSTPKCLLPIAGTPLLGIWLELCRRHGIAEVLLNLHAHAGVVRDYLSRQSYGVRITLFEESNLLGSAGTLAANRDWVRSEDCFWVLYADVLTNVDLSTMLAFHRARPSAATIGVYRVPDPTRCGIVTVGENQRVTHFVEKPAQPASNLAFTGVLVATPEVLEAIPDQTPTDLGHDVLPRLAGRMSAYEIEDFLLDIGTRQNYEGAQATWPGRKSVARERQKDRKTGRGPHMLDGVIFDLDGVLADTHPVHRRAWRQFLLERGRQVSEQELDFVLEGHKREEILEHFLGGLSPAEGRRYGERKQELFEESADQVGAIPGVIRFIEQCQNSGIPLAVATSASKRRTHSVLERLGLAGRFSAVVTGDDVRQGKPDPSVFQQAADGMCLPADSLLVAEDSQAGVRAAKCAGMKCLGLAHGALAARLYREGADWVVGDFREISLPLIEKLFSLGGEVLRPRRTTRSAPQIAEQK